MTGHCYHCGTETEFEQFDVGEFHMQFCMLCFTGDAWADGERRIAGTPEWRQARAAMKARMKRAKQKASA